MKSEGKNAMQPNYNKTRRACYRGYIVQGVINNLSPLFFVIFQRDYQVTYGMLSSLILFNFVTQILVDVLCVKFVDRIGYRAAGVTAHLFSTVGLLLLGLLPRSLPSPFAMARPTAPPLATPPRSRAAPSMSLVTVEFS